MLLKLVNKWAMHNANSEGAEALPQESVLPNINYGDETLNLNTEEWGWKR